MGNRVCKKCGLPANSHLLGAHNNIKERRHCLNHNKDIYGVCQDCDNSTHTHCYHSFVWKLTILMLI